MIVKEYLLQNFFKLSPNNNTKDVRNSDDRLDVNNIFNLDRLSTNNTIESGISMTYGADFSIMNKESSDEILGFKFANNLRLKKQDDLPNRNQLGSKTSNFFAEATYRPSKYFTQNIIFLLKIIFMILIMRIYQQK